MSKQDLLEKIEKFSNDEGCDPDVRKLLKETKEEMARLHKLERSALRTADGEIIKDGMTLYFASVLGYGVVGDVVDGSCDFEEKCGRGCCWAGYPLTECYALRENAEKELEKEEV